MKRLSVLFLGGAKRVSMVHKFINAARKLKCYCDLYSYELSTDVPIGCVARIIVGKRWSDPGVVDDLRSVIRGHKIDVVIPFVDGACEIAAHLASDGTVYSPVANPKICHALYDKLLADALFRSHNIPVPDQYDYEEGIYPIIAKPRTGSASAGIAVLYGPDDLAELTLDPDNYIFQRYIADRVEYSVDCFVDYDHSQLAVVPRRRIEVLGGEAVRTVTVDDADVLELAESVISKLNITGAFTLQFLRDTTTNHLMLMEINPRLGGGAVCAVHAGANLPMLILREALGLETEHAKWMVGCEIARYFSEVVVNKSDKWMPIEEL